MNFYSIRRGHILFLTIIITNFLFIFIIEVQSVSLPAAGRFKFKSALNTNKLHELEPELGHELEPEPELGHELEPELGHELELPFISENLICLA